MELHQFRHSAFCEKVRLILAVKGLQVTLVEVSPGLGQLEVFRLSGSAPVPVLVDGGEVIADSTAIALHLEDRHPIPALLPQEPQARARVLLLEDWADTALAGGARQALLQAAAVDPVLRTALLPDTTPSPLRRLVNALPGGVMAPLSEALSEVIGPCEARQLRRNLEQLALLTAERPYLDGDALSLADLAVVAQLSLLKIPCQCWRPLAGLGVEGIADNPLLAGLFNWRDRILAEAGQA